MRGNASDAMLHDVLLIPLKAMAIGGLSRKSLAPSIDGKNQGASMLTRPLLERHLIPLIMGLGIFWVANAEAANEQRCSELGANCIASEPLNTATYGYSNPYCNAGDTGAGDKQFAISGASAGNFIENSSGVSMAAAGWTFPTSGPMFTAMPNKSASITRFLQGAPEPSDMNFLTHAFTASDPTARRSIRWYQYFSSDWQDSTAGGSCLNSGKIFELGSELTPMVFSSSGNHMIYGFNGWNIDPFDCCNAGPGSGSVSMSPATMNGKWWRFELVVRNALPTGGVTIVELWRQNVTNGGANTKVLDTAGTFGPGTGGNNWTSTQATTLKPKARLDTFRITAWRNGVCTGYVGYSHFLAAAWSSDANQMIGAATELEGGGGTSQSIPAPANLR
jgi:hypothetical protein